jgi:cellulose synthase/poly-beta-1,6-N-acetylglucosamine synthase-like glycosyltransferase
MAVYLSTLLFYFYTAFLSLCVLGLLALHFYNRSQKRPDMKYGSYKGKVLVIVPCRGLDITLSENLKSLREQNYKQYDLIAVVDDESDEAVPIIKRVGIRYMTSKGFKSKGSGKVRAVGAAIKRFGSYSAYVIADSDITVRKNWLDELVAPLSQKSVGLSTTFPYFNPMNGGGFWSYVKMVWGFVGIGLMESERTRFGWGGSLAFRKELLDAKSFAAFSNSISDDIALTNIAKSKRLGLAYSPKARPIVNVSESFGSFFEWSNRQTALMMLGNRRLLKAGLAYYLISIVLFVSGVIFSIFYSPIFLVFLLPFALGAMDAYRNSDRKSGWIIAFYLFTLCVLAVNLTLASRMDGITWRGRKYDLRL